MISFTPSFARARAGPSARTPPPPIAAMSIIEIRMIPGQSPPIRATHAAAIAPAIIWPSAPMFQSPMDPATATASPAKPRGTARLIVFAQASGSPSEASNIRE